MAFELVGNKHDSFDLNCKWYTGKEWVLGSVVVGQINNGTQDKTLM